MARAKAVATGQLTVMSLRFARGGSEFGARSFIERLRVVRLVRLRKLLRQDVHTLNRKRLICASCCSPVFLAALAVQPNGHEFYFAHPRSEDPALLQCPYRAERPSQEEIERWRYCGQRESAGHKLTKARIARGLRVVASIRDVVEEAIWIGREGWKKPDVSAVWMKDGRDVRLAIEAQLSTTFISTIVKREAFYATEGAALVWILRKFDPARIRMMENDVVLPNNRNALVVNQETDEASTAAGTFMVEAHWHEPTLIDGEIQGIWKSRIVPFEALAISPEDQTCFYFDVAAREAELREQLRIEKARAEARRQEEEQLRRRQEATDLFLDLALRRPIREIDEDGILWDRTNDPKRVQDLHRAQSTFRALGAPFLLDPGTDRQIQVILQAVLSAKAGVPIGWAYSKLIDIPHHLLQHYPYALPAFAAAVQAYGRREMIEKQDRTGKWAAKKTEVWKAIKAKSEPFVHDSRWDKVLAILFPEIYTEDTKLTILGN